MNVSSTDKLTLLVHHKKQGTPAIEGIGILPQYRGVAVHDGFSSYDQYGQCRHGQCNAHILRELNYVIETSKPQWAVEMKALLLKIKVAVNKARESGRKTLPTCRKQEFLRKYDESIEQAKKIYGTLQRKKVSAKKPQAAELPIRAAGRKLVCRLGAKREEILLFMHDSLYPLTTTSRSETCGC